MTKIEIVKEIYAAINRNDPLAVLQYLDPEIKRTEPEGFPSSGVYTGLTEMKEHLSKSRETWAEGSCEPQEFISADNNIVVVLHVKVRLKNQQNWIDGHLTDVLTFRGEKVIEMRSFMDHQQALKWAKV